MEEGRHISWDEYFMGVAILASMRSKDSLRAKDPSCKVGACIVRNYRVLSLGYNGMPWGCSDLNMPWGKTNPDILETKYPYVVHAELNAILNANKDLTGSTLYVTRFPCNECAKACIQAGIKKIIYLTIKNEDDFSVIASKKMFNLAKVELIKYTGRLPIIEFKENEN